MMKKIFFLIILIFFSCAKKAEEKKTDNSSKIGVAPAFLKCIRWFDRDIYFAFQDPLNSNRNNEFHKLKVIDALKELERKTRLGEDYFRIKTVSQATLPVFQQSNLNWEEYRSAILIWEDSAFDNFAIQNYGGVSNLIDKNALTIVNNTFERKFVIILRASCFLNSTNCSSNNNNGINTDGIKSLVYRQIGYLLKLPPKNCQNYPFDIMCSEPDDLQYQNANLFFNNINQSLSTIETNKNFYNDITYSSSCLKKPWMDKFVYFEAQSGNPSDYNYLYNGFFQKESIKDALDEIGCDTLLGCNYFLYGEKPANSIKMSIDKQNNSAESQSSILIWGDPKFNDFVLNDIGSEVPDENALSLINAAKKSNFQMLFRGSCFYQDPNCSGNNNGISTNGIKALVARQLGLISGLSLKDCNDYPNDVMCSFPDDNQWNEENKFIWINKFNNILETIGNNPYFYDQYFEQTDTQN